MKRQQNNIEKTKGKESEIVSLPSPENQSPDLLRQSKTGSNSGLVRRESQEIITVEPSSMKPPAVLSSSVARTTDGQDTGQKNGNPTEETFVKSFLKFCLCGSKDAVKPKDIDSTSNQGKKDNTDTNKQYTNIKDNLKLETKEVQEIGYPEIWDDLKVIRQNTELKDAKVIFLADHHCNRVQDQQFAQLIESLVRRGNKVEVLVEGIESGRKVGIANDSITQFIKEEFREKIEVSGWDNPSFQNEAAWKVRMIEYLEQEIEENRNVEQNKILLEETKEKRYDYAISKRNGALMYSLKEKMKKDNSISSNESDKTIFVAVVGSWHLNSPYDDIPVDQNLINFIDELNSIVLQSKHNPSIEEIEEYKIELEKLKFQEYDEYTKDILKDIDDDKK